MELLVERIVASEEAWVQLRESHSSKPGAVLRLPAGARARVLARDDRFYRLAFEGTGPLPDWLERHGEVPLPPYIGRGADPADAARYQTVYARAPGAVAAPTAGLHFDETILTELAARGIDRAFVTLHVGAGTFTPVQHEDLTRHRMHAEWYTLPESTVAALAGNARRRRPGRCRGHHVAARARVRGAGRREACARARPKPRSSLRRGSALPSSIGCSPISICPDRRC